MILPLPGTGAPVVELFLDGFQIVEDIGVIELRLFMISVRGL